MMMSTLLAPLSLARGPLGLACLVVGVALAGYARHVPRRQATVETLGGGLMIAGLALIGSGLPLSR